MHADDLVVGLLVIVHGSREVVEGLSLGTERPICLASLLVIEYLREEFTHLNPFVPDEETMRIVILRMKVVCVHC